jgi:hypothetical protein
MDETMMKLRILSRAEVTLARVHGRILARRLLVTSLAVGSMLLTIIMVNLGAYELLAEPYGTGVAAFLIAGVNAALAGLLLLFASRIKAGPEEQMIQEIRDLALTELSADAEAVREGINEVTSDLERIRSSVGALTSGAAAGFGNLAPVLGLLVDALKHKK